MSDERSDSDGRLRVDRRTTIKWLAATMAAAHAACGRDAPRVGDEIPPATAAGNGLLGSAAAPKDLAYGTDPDLTQPAVPWPRTMTDRQLAVAAALADVILPADERSPSASAVGVPDFIDEWISAPYEQQREDRDVVLPGLERLERDSRERFGRGFAAAGDEERLTLVDAIARPAGDDPQHASRHEFFRRFRFLTVGAFYTTREGSDDLGYIGNVAIDGVYPGPSDAAMAHLAGVLERLGLSLPA